MADTTRRLRSGTVVLGGVGILAVALTACSSDPDKRCVDRNSYDQARGYKVVSDKDCKSSGSSSRGTTSSHTVWYYGGKKSGSYVDGGSIGKSGKSSGSSSSSSTGGSSTGGSGVDRGGFGGSDGGHGSSGG